MDITALLKKHMENRNMSIRELSEKSGVSESTIRRILVGNGENVRIKTLAKMCLGLKISLADFFDK